MVNGQKQRLEKSEKGFKCDLRADSVNRLFIFVVVALVCAEMCEKN